MTYLVVYESAFGNTRQVAEAMRAVRDEDADALRDPRIRSAVEQLAATARDVCASG